MKPKSLFALIVMLAALWMPRLASAHTHLKSSKPAQGDTVTSPLTEIHLSFTEAVDERYTTVVLLDASGHEITLGTLRPIGTSPSKEYILSLSRPLMAGAFTVKWKAAGSDGHATNGVFDFVVDVPDAISNIKTSPAPPPAATGHPAEHVTHHTTTIPPMYRAESSSFWIFARWLDFLGLMLMVGAVAFRFGVVERLRKQLDAALSISLDDGARQIGVFAAIACLAANSLRLWLQSGSLHGPDRMWESDLLSAMVFHTAWGKAWLAQSVAAVGYLVTVLIKTEERVDSWLSAGAFAFIAAATPAFAGHAAAVQQMAIVPMLDDAVHVIAASAWLGTLTLLLFVGLPRVLRGSDGFGRAALLVNTFSPVALVMAGITVFTGAMNAFVQITAFTDLWGTHYGRVLLLKLSVVAMAALTGAYNWRVLRPRLGNAGSTAQLRKAATIEVTFASVIILITAILVGTPNS